MTYAFVLGKNTALSVAEIMSVLKRDLFVFVILSISGNALVIKLDKRLENPKEFLDKLGGTIKIAEIFLETQDIDAKGPILEYISNSFSDSKFVFGISAYGVEKPRLGLEIKKELKKIGINSRFVIGKEKDLSAPEIKNNKMLTHGADFVLIRNGKKTFVGKTVAIQDYEFYSHRDWDRPRRNAKSGMLPPKVAQIMLNLIPNSPNNPKNPHIRTIYDPFCGQGTVLQEALLMGHRVIGSDISSDRVFDTKQNLKWLSQEYGLKIEPEKLVFQANALNLTKEKLPVQPDAIVSEVYLGPPMTGRESKKQVLELTDELRKEYLSFLNNIQSSNIQYLILAIPFYQIKNKVYFLNIIDGAKKLSYNVVDPFDNTGISFELLPEYDHVRKTILYSRPDQFVGREVVILGR